VERTGGTQARSPARSARLVITPLSLGVLFGAIVAAILLRNLFVAGRRPVGWAVAAAVMAAAIEPAVSRLSRYMKRGFALVCVLVPLLAFAGIVGRGVYVDLDRSTTRLQRAIPEAAERIEESPRFGGVARELNLSDRADEAAQRLEKPSSEVADKAAGSGSSWLVCTILTIFALAWGPRFSTGALRQVRDQRRRDRLSRVFGQAFTQSQAYVEAALVQSVVVGAVAWCLLRLFDVPAPTPLAVLIGVMSLVPVVGIFVGSLPAVMVTAGLDSFGRATLLLSIILVLQVIQAVLFRSITRRTLYIGPAAVVIFFLLGYDVYGVGGAVFGTAIGVFALALLDAFAEDAGPRDLPPAEADPTEPFLAEDT